MQIQKFLIAFLIVTLNFCAVAQHSTLPIKSIKGVNYYVYTVEPSEGLYAISKKFNVTQAEINSLNPNIHTGLQVGQEVLIPVNEKNMHYSVNAAKAKPETATQVALPNIPRQYIEHVVERRQTLFAISRKYNIDQEELILLNPELKDGLKIDQVIRIPVRIKRPATGGTPSTQPANEVQTTATPITKAPNELAKAEPLQIKSDTFLVHIVEPKETLYSLSRKYGVEVEAIIKRNPESQNSLQAGSALFIPRKPTAQIAQVAETAVANVDTNIQTSPTLHFEGKRAQAIKIAFLLPFGVDLSKNDPNMQRFTEFYQGALIAIYEAKQKGISFEIFTFDTDKTESELMAVLDKNNEQLKKMDVIVGPAYTNQVALVSDFARNNRILTIIPFTSRVLDIETNPYLLQFNPGLVTEYNILKFLLKNQYKNHNLIMVEADNISYSDEGRALYEMLLTSLKVEKKPYQVVKLSAELDFSKVVKRSEKNLILFNTNRVNVVGPHFAALTALSAEGNVSVYQQFSWQTNELKNLKGFYTAPFKDKMNLVRVKNFETLYNRFFNESKSSTLPRFDLLGYDLISFTSLILNKNNNTDISEKLKQLTLFEGIQSQMKFERMRTQSGFVNQYLFFIEK